MVRAMNARVMAIESQELKRLQTLQRKEKRSRGSSPLDVELTDPFESP
jgi:hypothetical protein